MNSHYGFQLSLITFEIVNDQTNTKKLNFKKHILPDGVENCVD